MDTLTAMHGSFVRRGPAARRGRQATAERLWVVTVLYVMGLVCIGQSLVFEPWGMMLIGLLWWLAASGLWLSSGQGEWDVFSPFTLWTFAFILMYVWKPLDLVWQGAVIDAESFLAALGYVIVGLLAFLPIYFTRIGDRVAASIPVLPADWDGRRTLVVGVVLFAAGLAAYGLALRLGGVGFLEVFSNLWTFRRFMVASGMAYLLSFVSMATLVPVLLWWCSILTRPRLRLMELAAWSLLVLCALVVLLSFGIRGMVLSLGLAILICYHYLRRRISLLWLAPLAILGAGFMAFFGQYRVARGYDDPLEYLASASFYSEETGGLSGFVYARFIGRANGFPTFMEILARFPYLLYGDSLRSMLVRPIPRVLWEAKPVETGTLVTQTLFPHIAEQSVALAPSMFGELYINFHVVGIVAGFVLLAVMMKAMDVYVRRNRTNKAVVLHYSLVCGAVTFGWLEAGFDSGATIGLVLTTLSLLGVFRIIRQPARPAAAARSS